LKGYFYPQTEEELSKYITELQGWILMQEEARKALSGAFHNINGESGKMEVFFYKSLPVRTETGVMMQKFKCDSKGQPIIPEGVEIIN
jgi:ribosomal protein L35AE/L33A